MVQIRFELVASALALCVVFCPGAKAQLQTGRVCSIGGKDWTLRVEAAASAELHPGNHQLLCLEHLKRPDHPWIVQCHEDVWEKTFVGHPCRLNEKCAGVAYFGAVTRHDIGTANEGLCINVQDQSNHRVTVSIYGLEIKQ